jgi:hypothetical protein
MQPWTSPMISKGPWSLRWSMERGMMINNADPKGL